MGLFKSGGLSLDYLERAVIAGSLDCLEVERPVIRLLREGCHSWISDWTVKK